MFWVDKFHKYGFRKYALNPETQKPLLLTAFVLISSFGKKNGFVYYTFYKFTKFFI